MWSVEEREAFIDFHLVGDEVVLLVMVYAKAGQENVKPRRIKRS